ncbi:hypothetical protein [Nonomuraea helvata]|uniref:Uncharacterized protein n=1 Tax=Nonomuraea helvata TaxID=37484 RepID=A0ABV5SCF8_9ACTN
MVGVQQDGAGRAEGKKACEELAAFLAKTEATAARFVERREERRARAAAAH